MNVTQRAVVDDCESLAVRVAAVCLDSNLSPGAAGMLRYCAAILASLARIVAGVLGSV